jgi:DNA-binding GntR family transcriptional regulator
VSSAARKIASAEHSMRTSTSRVRDRKSNGRHPKGRGALHVYEQLRNKILHVVLLPGQKLDEATLVRDLGVSRTPVREALIRLASEGLVYLLPNRGAQVAPLDLIDTAQYFEAFDLAQRAAARWAALRCRKGDLVQIRKEAAAYEAAVRRSDVLSIVRTNHDLHVAIVTVARNRHLEMMLRRLLEHGMRLGWMWLQHLPPKHFDHDMHRSVREHRNLVNAIADGDANRAEKIAHEHTNSFRTALSLYLSQSLATGLSIEPKTR